jgi:hypothetical protein
MPQVADTKPVSFIVRLPAAVHRAAKDTAERLGLSLNRFCQRAIEELASSGIDSASVQKEITPQIREGVEYAVRVFRGEILGVVLFGSCARGTQTAGSDIDLLVCVNPGIELNRDLYQRWDEEAPDSVRRVSPHFARLPRAGSEFGSLWFEVALEGIVLWETNFEVSRALAMVRDFLLHSGVERKHSYGAPYWVRPGVSL